jgi:hypothetical protein
MTDLHAVLERIPAPPATAGFHDALADAIAADERARARRRRAAAVVATAAAVVVCSATGVLAFRHTNHVAVGTRTVDRTISCVLSAASGFPSFEFDGALSKGAAWTIALERDIGQPTQLAGAFGTKPGGLAFNATLCRKATPVPLARAGLRRVTTLAGKNSEVSQQCNTGARTAIRIRALVRNGSAISGSMSVRTGAKQRPLMYATWTARRLDLFAGPDCSY